MVKLRHHPIEITCPETGKLIWVSRSVRDDPVGQLFAVNLITRTQYDAALAYAEDVEALDGRLRAPSRPDDVSWRGQRSDSDRSRKHRSRIERAHGVLGTDRTRLIRAVVVEGSSIRSSEIREFGLALDRLAVAYGLSTPTRH